MFSPRLFSSDFWDPALPSHRQRLCLQATAGRSEEEPPALPGGGSDSDEISGSEAEEVPDGQELCPGTLRGLPRGAAFPNFSRQQLLEAAKGTTAKMGCTVMVLQAGGGSDFSNKYDFSGSFLNECELFVLHAGSVPVCPQGNGMPLLPPRDGW